MISEQHKEHGRDNYSVNSSSDLIITGGGLSGTCAAITAARSGMKVILLQDRPVLGGNSSSEVRLWILGATSHMGNNNRWAREGGVIDEILIENLYRNKEGNPVIFDTILLEKITNEPNIILLLNTAVFEVIKKDENTIERLRAFCSQTSTEYVLSAPLFIDSSGDGIVGFLAGAPFRMGAETKEEFGELFAPNKEYGEMLGHTIYFYSKDAGQPVKYVAPAFALKDVGKIPRYKAIDSKMNGCQFWWIEYGGRFNDTVKETENIKWELWKVVYGVWDYIKNSGTFPDVDNLTLEWVGTIPGKRESRRFEGLYMLKQQDVIEQRRFDDAVAFGGWALDLHPADGVYSKLNGCNQWHSKGIYPIPYRSLVSKSIHNLFFAGRIISATHVAFASTRVMATSAHGAQAAATAASICKQYGINTKKVLEQKFMSRLQNQLNLMGQSIPGKAINYSQLQIDKPNVKVSSTYELNELASNGEWISLEEGLAQLLPLSKSVKYRFEVRVNVNEESKIQIQLRKSSKEGNFTPDIILETIELKLPKGKQSIRFSFDKVLDSNEYAFLVFQPNEKVQVKTSEQRLTGTLSLFMQVNKNVSNYGKQEPPVDIGVDAFELWTPKRRPEGKNLAFSVFPAIKLYSEKNLTNGFVRPFLNTNAWAASIDDNMPEITLSWDEVQKIQKIRLFFDTDYDHPLESVLMGHPENIIPFCVQNYAVYDKDDNLIYEKTGNYQTINDVEFDTVLECTELKIRLEHPSKFVPAALFEIICLNPSI